MVSNKDLKIYIEKRLKEHSKDLDSLNNKQYEWKMARIDELQKLKKEFLHN